MSSNWKSALDPDEETGEAEHGGEGGEEFFVAGGDAAEGFELGEEVFDAVTFAIEMLVKGGLLRSVGVYGYDGDAAELVHISTDGVAIVALSALADYAARLSPQARPFLRIELALLPALYHSSLDNTRPARSLIIGEPRA